MSLFEEQQDCLLAVTVPWTPRTKGRPRVTKHGTYTPPEVQKAEKSFIEQFNAFTDDHTPFDFPVEMRVHLANTFVDLEFFRADDYTNRKLRGDLDNYIKLISDALNGVAYVDDRLIVKLMGAKL